MFLDPFKKRRHFKILNLGFTDIDHETLMTILHRDSLGIREHRVFDAVVRWSECECNRQEKQITSENKRKVLKEALRLIRYPLMTVEEFAAGPAQSDLLKKEEVVEIFLHFTVNPKVRVYKEFRLIGKVDEKFPNRKGPNFFFLSYGNTWSLRKLAEAYLLYSTVSTARSLR